MSIQIITLDTGTTKRSSGFRWRSECPYSCPPPNPACERGQPVGGSSPLVSTSPSWLFTTWGSFQREPHFYALKLPASRYSSLEWTSVYIRHLLCVRNCLGIWGTGGTGRELPPEAGSRPRRGTSPRACPPAPRRLFYLSLSFLKYFMHK